MRVPPVSAYQFKPIVDLAPTAATGTLNQDFMTLLIAQLQNQDPLEPMSGTEFMGQLAQLQSVAELSSMNTVLLQLVDLQTVSPTLSLIGREVEWLDPDTGDLTSGVVERVEFTADRGPVLMVDGHEVSLDQVVSVGLPG